MIAFQFHHYVKEEYVDEYISILIENIEKSVLEEGFLQFDFLRDTEDPSHFILLEVYRDQEARDFHLQTSHFLKFKDFALGNGVFVKKGIGYDLAPL